jgi:hypothetical protein
MMKMLSVLLLLLGALSLTTQAATSSAATPLPTNFIQSISLQLSVVAPGKMATNGSSSTVSNLTISTKEAIQAIGQATTNSFSAQAQLLVVAPIAYYTNSVVTTNNGKAITNSYVYGYIGNPAFQIRDGTKVVDVSQFITFTTLNSNTYIASYNVNRQGGYTSYKTYRVRSIAVSNTALAFSGQGFVESPSVFITVKPGVLVYGYDDNWTSFTGVAANGVLNGILQGTINATYLKLE